MNEHVNVIIPAWIPDGDVHGRLTLLIETAREVMDNGIGRPVVVLQGAHDIIAAFSTSDVASACELLSFAEPRGKWRAISFALDHIRDQGGKGPGQIALLDADHVFPSAAVCICCELVASGQFRYAIGRRRNPDESDSDLDMNKTYWEVFVNSLLLVRRQLHTELQRGPDIQSGLQVFDRDFLLAFDRTCLPIFGGGELILFDYFAQRGELPVEVGVEIRRNPPSTFSLDRIVRDAAGNPIISGSTPAERLLAISEAGRLYADRIDDLYVFCETIRAILPHL